MGLSSFFPFSHRRSSDMEGQLRHTHSRHSNQRPSQGPVDETRRLDYPQFSTYNKYDSGATGSEISAGGQDWQGWSKTCSKKRGTEYRYVPLPQETSYCSQHALVPLRLVSCNCASGLMMLSETGRFKMSAAVALAVNLCSGS